MSRQPAGANNVLRLRRSLDEHLQSGRMTWNEFAMFVWLCLKASPRNGVIRTSWTSPVQVSRPRRCDMAMLCALDWRHYGVIATLSQDAGGGARLVLSHGADEVVVHLSWASLDALTYAGLQCPRPKEAEPWDLSRLSCL